MGLFSSLSGSVRLELTSPDLAAALQSAAEKGIELLDVQFINELSITCSLRRNQYSRLRDICTHRGDSLKLLKRRGLYWKGKAMIKRPVLIGGGVGVPPMYMLAKKLVGEGKDVTVILGFNTEKEVFYEEEFKALGCKVGVTTVDGSHGTKGFVTALMDGADYTHTFCCGPEPMLKAVFNASKTSGQYSFEERMGCGFGACMGCSCKTVTGYKRICKEGPVLYKEEILW